MRALRICDLKVNRKLADDWEHVRNLIDAQTLSTNAIILIFGKC